MTIQVRNSLRLFDSKADFCLSPLGQIGDIQGGNVGFTVLPLAILKGGEVDSMVCCRRIACVEMTFNQFEPWYC
jgi:hypothetical protein